MMREAAKELSKERTERALRTNMLMRISVHLRRADLRRRIITKSERRYTPRRGAERRV
jgi:hypothetical protein